MQAAEGGAAGVPGRPDSAVEKLVQVSNVGAGRCWQWHSAKLIVHLPLLGACIRHATAWLHRRACHSLAAHATPPPNNTCYAQVPKPLAPLELEQLKGEIAAELQVSTHGPGSKWLLNAHASQPAM